MSTNDQNFGKDSQKDTGLERTRRDFAKHHDENVEFAHDKDVINTRDNKDNVATQTFQYKYLKEEKNFINVFNSN